MDEFQLLWNACKALENSLNNTIIGAASYSCAENGDKDIYEWEKIIFNKLNDIKLLNSKAVLLNASILKERIQNNENISLSQVIDNLKEDTSAYERWNNALKFKAISRAIYIAFYNNDKEKIEQFKELLFKLSNLDHTINNLNLKEDIENKKLDDISRKWKESASIWMDEKKRIIQESQSKTITVDDDLNKQFSQLLTKMETIKGIQGRLLGSSMHYDWLRDTDNLQKYLISTRKPPFKLEDFK